jgi:hypothetical protein
VGGLLAHPEVLYPNWFSKNGFFGMSVLHL